MSDHFSDKTRISCEISGFSPKEIMPNFVEYCANVKFLHRFPTRPEMRYARTAYLLAIYSVVFAAATSPASAAGRRGMQPDVLEGSQPHSPVMAQVSVCFVPQQACDVVIVGAITGATKFIRVQAYSFTSPTILQALAEARSRGVDVQAILDRTDDRPDGDRTAGHATHAGGARFTAGANIPTWIDDSVAIAHNKIIVVDGHLVIGGSYNYSARAEHRNAENVTIIDSPEVASLFLNNWESRKGVSRPSSLQFAAH
jgi:phosphatidylserine/phosphatidylglycerophosphate/cardiolipin synthase-like enzyme